MSFARALRWVRWELLWPLSLALPAAGCGSGHLSACNSILVPDEIRVRRVEIDGGMPGAVHRLLTASGAPDVATGASGFGIVYLQPDDHDAGRFHCALRFVKLDASFGDPRYVGILGEGADGDVRWVPDQSRWVTAWTHSPGGTDDPDAELRVAAIDASGTLDAPPIRNLLVDHDWTNTPVRVAVTPDALAFVYSWSDDTILSYLPADRMGVATASPRTIGVESPSFMSVNGYGATGTGDGFAVLSAEVQASPPETLVLRLFRSVP